MRQALELALETLHLTSWYFPDGTEVRTNLDKRITAIKEALAQPEQEPVCDKDPQGCWSVRCQLGNKCKNTPPQRTWVGLTDEEVFKALNGVDISTARVPPGFKLFAQAIEAKLKEKNT